MRKFWSIFDKAQIDPERIEGSKKNTAPAPEPEVSTVTWDEQAKQSIEQAIAQAPVPSLLKGRIKNELMKAAELEAVKAGRNKVTAPDVMAGLLAKMPAAMRDKVAQAMQEGPEGLKNLEHELKNQK